MCGDNGRDFFFNYYYYLLLFYFILKKSLEENRLRALLRLLGVGGASLETRAASQSGCSPGAGGREEEEKKGENGGKKMKKKMKKKNEKKIGARSGHRSREPDPQASRPGPTHLSRALPAGGDARRTADDAPPDAENKERGRILRLSVWLTAGRTDQDSLRSLDLRFDVFDDALDRAASRARAQAVQIPDDFRLAVSRARDSGRQTALRARRGAAGGEASIYLSTLASPQREAPAMYVHTCSIDRATSAQPRQSRLRTCLRPRRSAACIPAGCAGWRADIYLCMYVCMQLMHSVGFDLRWAAAIGAPRRVAGISPLPVSAGPVR